MRVLFYLVAFVAAWVAFAAACLQVLPATAQWQTFDLKVTVPAVVAILLTMAPLSYAGKFEVLMKDARIPSHARNKVFGVAQHRQATLLALAIICPLMGSAPILLNALTFTDLAFASLAGAGFIAVSGTIYVATCSMELSRWEKRIGDEEVANKKYEQRQQDVKRLRGKLNEPVNYP